MEKPFRPIPLDLLARWIFRDLARSDTVLGIPRQNFATPAAKLRSRLLGRSLGAPLGVAAGPHTQLAQNIVASWLCGARFMELKTVQVLDELTVSRPCIDSADETYNCEWSQELKLEQSFAEYLHAWVLVHALAHALGRDGPETLFNMSVGYDLAGIQDPRVQRFVSSMRDARHALPAAIDAVAKVYPAVRDIDIPWRLSDHVTLSTMHGCPPSEIERIARYLLFELGVHTWVKLNPTLLGPERLRSLLNGELGFDVEVPDAAFAHDPTFDDAMAMVKSVAGAADGRPQQFGLKLTNTLEVVNHRPVFPKSEKMMYLSGRALHPLSLELARQVTEALDGKVPVSFCGGADARSFPDLVADGLTPVTVCTDLLKPGGYARLQQYLANLESAMERAGASNLTSFVAATSRGRGARANLARHASAVAGEARFARRARPLVFKGDRPLSYFDCIAAPCQDACPAHQNIPDYLWLVARGRTSEAMEVIVRTNPQPGITGSICEHPCTERCVRNFYDAPLAIREVKRFAFEHGKAPAERAAPPRDVEVAIVGAGPAGLSAAYFLAHMGFQPVVFETKKRLGGMVGGVIPAYRLSAHAIDGDIDRLRQLGVRFELGQSLGRDLQVQDLRKRHRYVFLAVGAQNGKRFGIPGEEARGVLDALTFLERVQAKVPPGIGRRILVVGGGNTAMDAARAARRLVPDGEVTLVYRRTRAEMPADPGEVRDCMEEGVGLLDLLAPARVASEGGTVVGLACTPMKLGERDASGRPRPVPAGTAEVILPGDTIISAIGQEPAMDFLRGLDVVRRDGTIAVDAETCETSIPGLFAGGDMVRGASSVIKAIADGRAVAAEIGRRHGVSLPPEPKLDKQARPGELLSRKSLQMMPQTVPVLPVPERSGFAEVVQSFTPESAAAEASRCLDCDDLCSLCVTVCPNRANQAYATAPLSLTLPSLVVRNGGLVPAGSTTLSVAQAVQILKIGDLCNSCGNCDTFCPTSAAPYRKKPCFWIDADGWRETEGDAFRFERSDGAVTLLARLGGRHHRLERRNGLAEYRSEQVVARLSADPWALLDCEAAGALQDGERIDLSVCATLIALLQAEPVLPTGTE
jgi:putative selenate reductase